MRVPPEIHDELVNWSRWCWLGDWPHPLPAIRCGSLESQYRAPPDWNPEDPPPPPTIRPNDRHARVVQRVYEALPFSERLVLKAEYPARLESGRLEGRATAAVRLNMQLRAYEERLQSAVNKVGEAFAVCE